MIVDHLIKIVYYKLINTTTDTARLAGVVIDVVVSYHGLFGIIIINNNSLLILKFWFLLYYFLGIKQKIFTVFHLRIDGQTKTQNNTMETYLHAFVNG